MKQKLFIDDCRNPPDKTWTVARTNTEAIALLRSQRWDIISIDHDIEAPYISNPKITETFMPVVWFIVDNNQTYPIIVCHSFNTSARKDMVYLLTSNRSMVIDMPFDPLFYNTKIFEE